MGQEKIHLAKARTYRIGVLLPLQEGRELQHPEFGAGHAAALPWGRGGRRGRRGRSCRRFKPCTRWTAHGSRPTRPPHTSLPQTPRPIGTWLGDLLCASQQAWGWGQTMLGRDRLGVGGQGDGSGWGQGSRGMPAGPRASRASTAWFLLQRGFRSSQGDNWTNDYNDTSLCPAPGTASGPEVNAGLRLSEAMNMMKTD